MNIPHLGVGMGFRQNYMAELFLDIKSVDFLEITADHYFTQNTQKLDELALLKENFILIPHGLDLSLGSAEGLDKYYLEKMAKLVDYIKPYYWSEHLCFTKAGGISLGHLASVPYTQEAIDVFCKNIETAQNFIPFPLILENITTSFSLPGSEMSEALFIKKIIEISNHNNNNQNKNLFVGLLLDVTNLYINAQNLGFDYKKYLAEYPTEYVVQCHFVGYYTQKIGEKNWLVDGHANYTNPEIWEILEYVIKNTPVKGLILERDENFPPFEMIKKELSQARQIFG
jgi:uncharacterized protein